MTQIFIYSIASVAIVSAISLIGIFAFSIKEKKLAAILIYLVSFSTGALFGDAFIHLLPKAANDYGAGIMFSISILAGIIISFIIEKFIHWQHCHLPQKENHIHHFAVMSLWGDSIHNFIDGLIIGASYLMSIPVGIATTLAVIFHEIPQEIGDFGILLHGGYTKKKALLVNFLTALFAFGGLLVSFIGLSSIKNINSFLIPFAAGNFIYIAGSDLVPELHRELSGRVSLKQLIAMIFGIVLMLLLLYFE